MKTLLISFMEAVLLLTGASDPQELSSQVLEKYEYYSLHPLKINYAPASRLLASGLFSSYQVATLLDYRSSGGAILSVKELSLVDGFREDTAGALGLFLSFEGELEERSGRISNSAVAKADLKSAGGKYKFSWGDYADAAAAFKTPYETPAKTSWTAYGAAYLRHWRIVGGDYNLRFGEGLALWTGFSITSLSSIRAFYRGGSGLSPSWSFTGDGTLRGVAASFDASSLSVTGFVSFKDGFLAGANVNYLFRMAQLGMTVTQERVAVDARASLGRVYVFSEGAYDWKRRSWGAVAGGVLRVSPFSAALRFRAIPSAFSGKKNGEYSASAGLEFYPRKFRFFLSAEALLLPVPVKDPSRRSLKLLSLSCWQPSDLFSLSLRAATTLKNYDVPHRTDIRLDASLSPAPWSASLRGNLVISRSAGALVYMDAGRKTDVWSVYLRATWFKADSWDDRLYSYERDAPGNFNVPAYYKSGVAVSALAGVTLKTRHLRLRAYLRTGAVFYYRHEKPDSYTVKLQLMLD